MLWDTTNESLCWALLKFPVWNKGDADVFSKRFSEKHADVNWSEWYQYVLVLRYILKRKVSILVLSTDKT